MEIPPSSPTFLVQRTHEAVVDNEKVFWHALHHSKTLSISTTASSVHSTGSVEEEPGSSVHFLCILKQDIFQLPAGPKYTYNCITSKKKKEKNFSHTFFSSASSTGSIKTMLTVHGNPLVIVFLGQNNASNTNWILIGSKVCIWKRPVLLIKPCDPREGAITERFSLHPQSCPDMQGSLFYPRRE